MSRLRLCPMDPRNAREPLGTPCPASPLDSPSQVSLSNPMNPSILVSLLDSVNSASPLNLVNPSSPPNPLRLLDSEIPLRPLDSSAPSDPLDPACPLDASAPPSLRLSPMVSGRRHPLIRSGDSRKAAARPSAKFLHGFLPKALGAALALALLCPAFAPGALAASDDDTKEFNAAWKALNAWDLPEARRHLDHLAGAGESGTGEGGAGGDSGDGGTAEGARGSAVRTADEERALKMLQAEILFQEGRLKEADALSEELLTSLDVSDPSMDAEDRERARERLQLVRDTWNITRRHLSAESEHFVLRYPAGKDASLAPYALETLEKEREALGRELGHLPPGKVTVEVYPSAQALSQATTLPLKAIKTTGTVAICKFNKLMVASPMTLVQGYGWRDTLAHEYVHLVVSQASGDHVPVWVHEGLAKFYETAWRAAPGEGGLSPASAAFLSQESKKKDALIPFARMHPSIALLPSQEDAALAYAEAFTAIEYLVKSHGPVAVRQLLAAYAQGMDDAQAFKSATGGVPFPRFVEGWERHVKARPAPMEALSMDAEKRKFASEDGGKASPPPEGTEGEENGERRESAKITDFPDLKDPEARRRAHLGELLRVRNRPEAAAAEFRQAYAIAGDSSPLLSNRYAQALMAIPDGAQVGENGDAKDRNSNSDGANSAGRGEGENGISGEADTGKSAKSAAAKAKAAEILVKTRQLFPSHVRTLKNLGILFTGAGRKQEAMDAWLGLVARDPFDPVPHRELLNLCTSLDDAQCVQRETKVMEILKGQRSEW